MEATNTKELTEKLNNLFQFVPPTDLRKSVQEAFFGYLLQNQSPQPENFEKTVLDFYFLILFLQDAEEIWKEM